jgi:hypothetical protein
MSVIPQFHKPKVQHWISSLKIAVLFTILACMVLSITHFINYSVIPTMDFWYRQIYFIGSVGAVSFLTSMARFVTRSEYKEGDNKINPESQQIESNIENLDSKQLSELSEENI